MPATLVSPLHLQGACCAAFRARAQSHIALPQVPERRACPDRAETDVNKHDESFSEEVLRVSGMLFRGLCPKACIVRCIHIDSVNKFLGCMNVQLHYAL